MTARTQSIVLCSIIGTLLAEYSYDENTKEIAAIRSIIRRFMMHEARRDYRHFLNAIKIGDDVWRRALDKFAKDKIVVNVVAMIYVVWNFNPEALTKYVNFSRKRIDSYIKSSKEYESNSAGAVVGGHIFELLSEIMGKKVNGKMVAIKLKLGSGL